MRARSVECDARAGSGYPPLAIAVDQPVAAALVASFWIYAEEPRTARLIVELGVFRPMVLILRQLVTVPCVRRCTSWRQFQLRAWTHRFDRHLVVRSERGVAVYAAFQEAGFSIPLPQQEVRILPAALPPESDAR